MIIEAGLRIRNFLGSGTGSAGKKSDPDPTLIRNDKKKHIFIYEVGGH